CAYATIVSHDGCAITIYGHRRVLLSGSIHYFCSTDEMWPNLIKKGKERGLDAIETYVFWNAHEPTRRQYDFSGNLDLILFFRTIQNEGICMEFYALDHMFAHSRITVWVHNMPIIEFRTTNTAFMNEMQNLTTMIIEMIENEYGNVIGSYGEAGMAYI
ncbi:beta-galactosidase-like protein, partial [Arabidopsis thaliana]